MVNAPATLQNEITYRRNFSVVTVRQTHKTFRVTIKAVSSGVWNVNNARDWFLVRKTQIPKLSCHNHSIFFTFVFFTFLPAFTFTHSSHQNVAPLLYGNSDAILRSLVTHDLICTGCSPLYLINGGSC